MLLNATEHTRLLPYVTTAEAAAAPSSPSMKREDDERPLYTLSHYDPAESCISRFWVHRRESLAPTSQKLEQLGMPITVIGPVNIILSYLSYSFQLTLEQYNENCCSGTLVNCCRTKCGDDDKCFSYAVMLPQVGLYCSTCLALFCTHVTPGAIVGGLLAEIIVGGLIFQTGSVKFNMAVISEDAVKKYLLLEEQEDQARTQAEDAVKVMLRPDTVSEQQKEEPGIWGGGVFAMYALNHMAKLKQAQARIAAHSTSPSQLQEEKTIVLRVGEEKRQPTLRLFSGTTYRIRADERASVVALTVRSDAVVNSGGIIAASPMVATSDSKRNHKCYTYG